MTDLNKHRSCATHCCKNHGCKYGHEDCPVSNGEVAQEYLCEYCTWPLEEREIFELNVVATDLAIAYSRTDRTIADLPSEEQVTEAVRKALVGLEIAPGWTIEKVLD